nr:MAG TPA: hypothetical protein [Caudoviricetes sp.]
MTKKQGISIGIIAAILTGVFMLKELEECEEEKEDD